MKILGPIPCVNCGKTVWWDLVDMGKGMRKYVLMEGDERHVCTRKTKAAA